MYKSIVQKIKILIGTLKGIFALVVPYGRRKLALLGVLIVVQAFAQMVAVAGLFPFLNLLVKGEERPKGLSGWLAGLVPEVEGVSPLVGSGIVTVLILVVSSGVGFYAGWMRSRVSWGISHYLRTSLMKSMMSRSYEWHTQQNSSVLAKKALSDCHVFTLRVIIPFLTGVSNVILILVLGWFVVLLDWRIGAMGFLFFSLIYFVFFWGLNPWRTKISDQTKLETRDIFQRVGEVFSGFKLVVVYGKERLFLQRVEETSSRYCSLAVRGDVLSMSSRFVVEPLIAILVICFLFIIDSSEGGVMNAAPVLGVSAIALLRLLPAFRSLYSALNSIGTHRFSYQELRDELEGQSIEEIDNEIDAEDCLLYTSDAADE